MRSPERWLGISLFLALPDFYLTESVYKIVSQESIPAQIRQLIPYISNDKG